MAYNFVKRGLVFLFFLLVLIKFSSAISVSPSSYSIDFEPGLEQAFNFDFRGGDSDLEIFLEGDLTDYATLDKTVIKGSGSVSMTLKLPSSIAEPGRHIVLVGARPSGSSGAGGVGAVTNVRSGVAVFVPYPGKYADLDFSVEDSNSGEPVDYVLKIYSRGDDKINAAVKIDIYDSENISVGSFDIGNYEVPSSEEVDISSNFDTSRIGSGNYLATALISYGNGLSTTKSDNFRLGELNVRVVNYTRELEKEIINPFSIEVESLWNDRIDNLYAQVYVLGSDVSFLTPSVELLPWKTAILTGYFDTTGLEAGNEFQVKIVLHYGNEFSEETAILKFVNQSNYFVYAAIALGIIAVISFVFWVVFKLKRLEAKSHGGKK